MQQRTHAAATLDTWSSKNGHMLQPNRTPGCSKNEHMLQQHWTHTHTKVHIHTHATDLILLGGHKLHGAAAQLGALVGVPAAPVGPHVAEVIGRRGRQGAAEVALELVPVVRPRAEGVDVGLALAAARGAPFPKIHHLRKGEGGGGAKGRGFCMCRWVGDRDRDVQSVRPIRLRPKTGV